MDTGITAGVGSADITPETGKPFQGYVRPDIRSEGVGTRLFVNALVLDDGDETVALVSADLLYGIDKEEVVERLSHLGFSHDNLLYSGTHTHASTDAGEITAERVAAAVEEAVGSSKPAVAGWGTATVEEANRNRSVEAHLANHGYDISPGEGSPDLDPEGADHTRDKSLSLLRVDSADGEHIGAWCRFSVHPTALPPSNTVYSADIAGVAVRRFANSVGEEVVALFANGASGDVVPVYDGCNGHVVADRIGGRIADGMVDAWKDAGEGLSEDVCVSGKSKEVEYEGQEVEPGKRVGSRGVFGVPFLGGAENGPSPLRGLGLEGRRRPSWLADKVHGRKIPSAPVPWDATVEVQVVRVGSRLLLAAPGEPTVETGRRWRDAAADAVPGGTGIKEVNVVGLANGYNGYFTTPAEYEQQHYEGGHTVFGKHSEALLRSTYAELAAGIDEERGSRKDSTESPSTSTTGRSSVKVCQSCEEVNGPESPVERMSFVEFSWSGGARGRDRPVGEPFIRLERSTSNGWVTVATDLDLGFVWRVDDGEYEGRYEVPPSSGTGEHRIRVTAKGYEAETDSFELVPSRDLRLLGVGLEDDRLVFRGQNPPPDPGRCLRARPVEAHGGEVSFITGGEKRTAEWDGDAVGWTADRRGVSRGDEVIVPEGGLRDGAGNRSGGETEIYVGERRDVAWPPEMEIGGGKPPGIFGIGRFPG